jgi:membrane fusion protein, peptide pheromone/bacteriocin exporter
MDGSEPSKLPRLQDPEDSLEAHLLRHSAGSTSVYLAVLLLLIGGAGMVPLVQVDVSVQANGIVRPAVERQEVRVQASGFVEEVRIANDLEVRQGEMLLRLRSDRLDGQRQSLAERISAAEAALRDLEALILRPSEPLGAARQSKYRVEQTKYLQEQSNAGAELEQAQRELDRLIGLDQRGLAAARELEEARLKRARSRTAIALLEQGYRVGWAEARAAEEVRLAELRREEDRLADEAERHITVAPLGGVLQEVASISAGGYVRGGDLLATISPDARLLADTYVDPSRVGLLRPEQPVRLMVDAFDYTDWGFLTGKLQTISRDYVLVDGRPAFQAVVQLDSTALTLANGVRGELRKGMTLQARFMVARRTLWQLLRDDLSDWLDPLQHRS